jgi:hypothetical protein
MCYAYRTQLFAGKLVFGDQIFQQSGGIPMGTNYVPLLEDLILNSYEAEFVQKLLRDKTKN